LASSTWTKSPVSPIHSTPGKRSDVFTFRSTSYPFFSPPGPRRQVRRLA
jgi:hypothetical protein